MVVRTNIERHVADDTTVYTSGNEKDSSMQGAAGRQVDEHSSNMSENRNFHHSDLSKLCIINTQSMERIQPNEGPCFVDNEFFSGYVIFMVRTPFADKGKRIKDVPKVPAEEGAVQAKISNYFRDKARRFEFQFQIKLKKLPNGPLFLGCEVEDAPKLNMIQRALTNTCLNVVKRLNNGFHFSLGRDDRGNLPDNQSLSDNTYENAHLAFAIESSMDIIIASKPGEELPKLGEPLHESEESVKRRKMKCRGSVNWNTKDTYTMAFWSCYVDWIQWKVMNFPGIPPFSLSDIVSKQPINLTVYCLEEKEQGTDKIKHDKSGGKSSAQQPHYRSSLRIFSNFELSHTVHSASHRYTALVASQARSDVLDLIRDPCADTMIMEQIATKSIYAVESVNSKSISIDSLTIQTNNSYDLLKHCTNRCGPCFDNLESP